MKNICAMINIDNTRIIDRNLCEQMVFLTA